MATKNNRKSDPDINYHLPVILHFRRKDFPSTPTVARRADGKFWKGKRYVRPDLWKTMDQVATPINGGFDHMSDEEFLDHVCLVFDFTDSAEFDFLREDFASGARQ